MSAFGHSSISVIGLLAAQRHQSGVVAVRVALTPASPETPHQQRLRVVSGGDDQVVRVVDYNRQWQPLASAEIMAHAAGVRGVTLHDATLVASTSTDERVQVWRIDDNPLALTHVAHLETGGVGEVASLTGDAQDSLVCVVGHGFKVLDLKQFNVK